MEFNIGKTRIETTGQTHILTAVTTVTSTAKYKHQYINEPSHLQNWEYEKKEHLLRSSSTQKNVHLHLE
jgi:hypothetical protein